ncbi:lysylphosphatidylglycerol synthase transmembrane domain-containing protein [Catellatospora sp. NPDC049609]|uniref:lysylphosphatidylglycerol synthase transmembrane domain-containing protein n=1 Tax=Catellatospora sp. NPDC049609 TaxID=3155505 RepID=UPI00343233AD
MSLLPPAEDTLDTPTPPDTDDEPASARPGPGWLRWARRLLPVVVILLALLTIRDRMPGPDEIWPVLTGGDLTWLAVALVAEWVSLSMFARQQVWLLRGVGTSVSLRSALAVTYSRSAIASSLPAGSALSAAFGYQSYRRWGADRDAATAVVLLSNLSSFAALALLYLTGFLVVLLSSPATAAQTHPAASALTLATATSIAALAVRRRIRHRAGTTRTAAACATRAAERTRAAEAADGLAARLRRQLARLGELLAGVVTAGAAIPARFRLGALGYAAANWVADLVCLAAVAQAFRLPLSLLQLGTIYVVVQLVRQIPISPGGLGVIEASLLTALTAAGAAEATATAVVIGYRLLSCWLIIPVGLTTWAFLRRAAPAPLPEPQPAT